MGRRIVTICAMILCVVFLAFFLVSCPDMALRSLVEDKVTGEDDTTPPDTNANLSALEISEGTLSPVFSSDVTSYFAGEQSTVSSITVTPTAESAAAAITVNSTAVASGTASGSIALTVGTSSITIEVTAEDGTTTKTYTITLCRAAVDLPKTGQTTIHETGDDGELQRGIAWPVPRFTDNANGTITDNLTGLMWDKTGNRFGTSTWAQALIDCNGLSLGGHSDWRLPNLKEFRSLVNYEEEIDQATWLNGQGFSSVQADYYWSSTTYAPNTSYAWAVDMYDGFVYYSNKAPSYYVLAVRAGQAGGNVSLPKTGQTTEYATGDDGDLEKGVAWPSLRFTVNGDGTIYDNLTGLMWEQAPSGATRTWTNALTYANDLVLGGHSDWRLPNVNELESLINAEEMDSAAWLNGRGFSNLQTDYYWTSTTYAPDTTYAWSVYVRDGRVSNYSKAASGYVLAVRSGQ